MNTVKFLSLNILIVFLAGCTVKGVAPGPILETPTVASNDFSGGFQVGNRPAQAVTVTRDYSARPINLSDRSSDEQTEFYFGPNISFRKFELKIDLSLFVGSTIRLKYQFLGPEGQTAKKDDWVAAGTYQVVSGDRNATSGTQTGSSSDVGYSTKVTLRGSGLGVSVGRYLSDRFLLFGGHTHMHYDLKYDITQNASGANPAANYNGTESSWASTTGLGGQFTIDEKRRVNIFGSLQYQRRPWPLSAGREGLGYELAMSFSF